jgi:hypothetical protein
MKLAVTALLVGSAAAFAPASMPKSSTALKLTIEELPGALPPMGIWDPLGFAEKADENTLKRYREAEVRNSRLKDLINSVCDDCATYIDFLLHSSQRIHSNSFSCR